MFLAPSQSRVDIQVLAGLWTEAWSSGLKLVFPTKVWLWWWPSLKYEGKVAKAAMPLSPSSGQCKYHHCHHHYLVAQLYDLPYVYSAHENKKWNHLLLFSIVFIMWLIVGAPAGFSDFQIILQLRRGSKYFVLVFFSRKERIFYGEAA